MGAPQATRADDAQTDAAAQRHRSLGDDAQDGMGPVQSAGAVVIAQLTHAWGQLHDGNASLIPAPLAFSQMDLHSVSVRCSSTNRNAHSPA